MTHRLLITGGSGLLAVNWAAARRHIDEIWLGLNNRQISMENTKAISLRGGLNHAIVTANPDIIINTAAMTNVDGCEADEKQAIAINCDLAATYAKIAYDHGLPFVHISTDHLFDGRQCMQDETAPCLPINSYGHSKWLGERAVLKAHPDALILRVNFFGWGPIYRPSFSDWILNSMAQGTVVTLYQNVYFTPLYVGDVVDLAHRLIAKNAKGIYHLTSSDRLSKYDFGLKLAAMFELDANLITPRSYNPKKGIPRPLDMSLDNAKALHYLRIGRLDIDSAIIALASNKSIKTAFSSID